MTASIHPTAVIDPRAELASDVEVGPYAVIGPQVQIGPNCWIGPHVVLDGRVSMGRGNRIFPGACIGMAPQDLKYAGDPTGVAIGDDNIIRECVTINRATRGEELTLIGSGNLLMAYSHLGHNCEIGNRIVIANSVAVAGHVVIADRAVIGGVLGIHQFVHIGTLAMVGGMSRIERDVPPFCLVEDILLVSELSIASVSSVVVWLNSMVGPRWTTSSAFGHSSTARVSPWRRLLPCRGSSG